MSERIDAIRSKPSWELDSVKDEWYKSRHAFGLQHLNFSSMNGRVELILMEEQGTENGQGWRLHFADYLITNNYLDMLNDRLITPNETLVELYDEYIAEGRKCDKLEIWKDSVLAYRKAIAARPKEVIPYYNLGVALMQTGDYEAAITHLYVALPLLPDRKSVPEDQTTLMDRPVQEFWTRYALAYSLHKMDRLSEATEQYKAAYSLSPSKKEADAIFSILDKALMDCIANQNWETAILLQQSVHGLKPDLLRLHTNLCSIYQQSGDLVSAKREGELAVHLAPDNFSALANLATVYMDLNMHHEAIIYYERSLAIEPSEIKMKVAYAYSLICIGRHFDAASQIDETLRIDPRNAMAIQLKQYLTNIGYKTA